MKSLISGINGFVGSYLAETLLKQGHEVFGLIKPGTNTSIIDGIKNRIKLFPVDILDYKALSAIFDSIIPNFVYHLAGATSVKESLIDPLNCFRINVNGTLNLLESIRLKNVQCKILLASSGEVYGNTKRADGLPLTENDATYPQSPYAASKVAVETLAQSYAKSFGLKTIIVRPLNHIGPRQSDVFFLPTLAKQIAEIENNKRLDLIEVGDLHNYRDFTDVRDVVRAYALLMEQGQLGEIYNICSGNVMLLKDIVDALLRLSGKKMTIQSDQHKFRNNDRINVSLDCAKIKAHTGWEPQYLIETSLIDILDYWRCAVKT